MPNADCGSANAEWLKQGVERRMLEVRGREMAKYECRMANEWGEMPNRGVECPKSKASSVGDAFRPQPDSSPASHVLSRLS